MKNPMHSKKIILPLVVFLPKKTKADKKIIINLNNYPYWHFMTYNEAKKVYKELLAGQLEGLTLPGKIKIEYTLFKKNKVKSDKMNVCAVQDKFFCDALVEYGCIADDDDETIISQKFNETKVDKLLPRVEAEIIYGF